MKEWIKPVIKQINLEFDKEMANNCHGSANPSHKQDCGIQNGTQKGCWNGQTGFSQTSSPVDSGAPGGSTGGNFSNPYDF